MRHAISIPAGIAKMSHAKFITLTTLAVIPWSIVFVYLGFKLGTEWESINKVAGPYVKYFALAAIVCAIGYFILKKNDEKKVITEKRIYADIDSFLSSFFKG